MTRFYSLLLALSPLWVALPAWAQVRNAPAGNELSEQAPVDPHDGHVHFPGDGHDHGDMDAAALSITPQQHAAFADAVRLDQFRKLAVFDGGRSKIIDTLAREQLNRIYGRHQWRDEETGKKYAAIFTYLDLLFNKTYYLDKPVIYIEVLPLRQSLVATLPPAEQELWLRRGRLAPAMFADGNVQYVLSGADSDLRLAKGRDQVLRSFFAFRQSEEDLHLVSPPPGAEHWARLMDVVDQRTATALPGGVAPRADAAVTRQVREQFAQLRAAWRRADAAAVNLALDGLVQNLPRLNPESYPSAGIRQAEYFYNATRRFTVGYVAYGVGAVLLLIAFGIQRKWLITTGAAFLWLGFLVHTAGIAVRMVLASRFTIHNQYESFIWIVWLAVLAGVIFMYAKRQWLFGAAGAALGACSLMVANTVDIPSNEVGQVAGILATSRILYVHVNMVLASYSLIALGFFVSLFYLIAHYLPARGAVQFAAAGLGAVEFDEGSPAGGSSGGGKKVTGRQSLLRDLDRAQLVVLQLAFWILGVGVLLGAYWADHAWGRWWAWDPKETWALITWIVYVIVIHVRFAAGNRGLVTAWLSVVGFFVMLWTYWGVNLLLAGLHSYA